MRVIAGLGQNHGEPLAIDRRMFARDLFIAEKHSGSESAHRSANHAFASGAGWKVDVQAVGLGKVFPIGTISP